MLKKIITLITMLLTLNVFAFGQAFPTSNSGGVKLTKAEALKRFNVSEPVCIKDGARLLRRNAAYTKLYGSEKTPCRKKWVTIIKVKDLETAVQKELLGFKK